METLKKQNPWITPALPFAHRGCQGLAPSPLSIKREVLAHFCFSETTRIKQFLKEPGGETGAGLGDKALKVKISKPAE